MRQSLLPLFDWYGRTGLARIMSDSATLIATAQIIHLIGMALLIGTIMMVDLTMLGFGFKRHPVSRVARELKPWTWTGLAIMFATGPLNLASEAQRCYDSSFFWIKMGLIVLAVAFHFTVHRRATLAEPPVSTSRAKLVACVSLALWFGVAIAAKFIGFYGEDLREAARGNFQVPYTAPLRSRLGNEAWPPSRDREGAVVPPAVTSVAGQSIC